MKQRPTGRDFDDQSLAVEEEKIPDGQTDGLAERFPVFGVCLGIRSSPFLVLGDDPDAVGMRPVDHERGMGGVHELVLLRQIFQEQGEILLSGGMEVHSRFVQKKDEFVGLGLVGGGDEVDEERKVPEESRGPGFGSVVYRGGVRKVDIQEFSVDAEFDLETRFLGPGFLNPAGDLPARFLRGSPSVGGIFENQTGDS